MQKEEIMQEDRRRRKSRAALRGALMKLMELMSTNPAKLYRMEPGSIQEGSPADVVIFGENEEWIAGDYASKAENSPFTGWTLPGKVRYTICNGKIVYKG